MQIFCIYIGKQEVGIPIDCVIQTSNLDNYTVLPSGSKFIVGLVNLRGDIVPVFNLSRFLGLQVDYSLNKVAYVVKNGIIFGIVISKLSKTVNIDPADISVYPHSVVPSIRNLFSGIVHSGDRNIQLLDLEKLILTIKEQEF